MKLLYKILEWTGIMKHKQVIIVNSDVKMDKGKMAAQVAHASIASFVDCQEQQAKIAKEWIETGMKKIVLKATQNEIVEFAYCLSKTKIPFYVVKDAGLTQIEPGTLTCIGIGPYKIKEIDKLTKGLKLM